MDAVRHIEICACAESDRLREENRELHRKVTELEDRLSQKNHHLRTIQQESRLQQATNLRETAALNRKVKELEESLGRRDRTLEDLD